MSNKNKRLRLIDEYKKIIERIPFQTEDGELYPMTDHYICPLCLKTFDLKALGEKINDLLTLEDVPPKALGGKPVLITCRECNSTCGHDLDAFLINEIRYFDEGRDFTKEKNAFLSCDGVEIRAKVIKEDNDGFIFNISRNNNNPSDVDEFLQRVEDYGDSWKIKSTILLSDYKRKPEVVEVAALKSAYLLAFKNLGYCYILKDSLTPVREQIKHPEENILNRAFVVGNEKKIPEKMPDGVFLASVNDRKCVIVIFSMQLAPQKQTHRAAVALPMPDDNDCLIYREELNQEKKLSGLSHLTILGSARVVENMKSDL